MYNRQEHDWANYGLEEGSVDVAVASRSVITHDLEDSLKKLSAVARERACVTVCTGVSPRVDLRVPRDMKLELGRESLADTADQISVEESAGRLRSFLADHLVEIEEDGAKCWTLDQPRVVPWAFISWDVGI